MIVKNSGQLCKKKKNHIGAILKSETFPLTFVSFEDDFTSRIG